jgi:hypothetical protein
LTAVRTTQRNSKSVYVRRTPARQTQRRESEHDGGSEYRGRGTPSSPTRLRPRAALQILTVWMLGGTANLNSPPRRIPPASAGGGCQYRTKLSSWARSEIISKIEYRAEIAGLHVEKVHPGNTSRSCPQCGATGHRTTSPDHCTEVWHGGHFRCDNTRWGFQGDRD